MVDVIRTTIKRDEADMRFDRWLCERFPALTQGKVRKLLRMKAIRLDNVKADAATRLRPGQEVSLPAWVQDAPHEIAPIPLMDANEALKKVKSVLLDETDDVIVLNKPAGLAVQGGTGVRESVDDWLTAVYGADARLVHRIDKDTSGLLIVAKNRQTASKLTAAFRDRIAQKSYLALVVGKPEPMHGEVVAPLGSVGDKQEKMAVTEDGLRANTGFDVIDHAGGKLSLVRLSPHTGRKHQLRVHMNYMGCPILGDGKYGGRDAFVEGLEIAQKLHLHAHSLLLPEDVLGSEMSWEAPLPKHMVESMKAVGLHLL